MLPKKRAARILAIVVVALVFHAAGYGWFVRSHTYYYFSSDVIEVSNSPRDCELLFLFYPALWLDARCVGFYDTSHFTHFNRVYAGDRSGIPGPHIFPFTTNGNYPEPPDVDAREFLLIAASLLFNAATIVGTVFLIRRFNRHERSG